MTFKALLYLTTMKQKQILPIAEQTWNWDEGWGLLTQISLFCMWWWRWLNICIDYQGTWANFIFVGKKLNSLVFLFPPCVCLNEGRWIVKNSPSSVTMHFYEAQGDGAGYYAAQMNVPFWPNPLYNKNGTDRDVTQLHLIFSSNTISNLVNERV